MGTIATVHPEPGTTPEAQPRTAKPEARPEAINKFVEARLAKKKQRRRAHRATIRRSNTGG